MIAGSSDSWWVVNNPVPRSPLRLLCIPHGGANASIFRSWHLALPKEVEVYGIQLPGHGNRISEPLFTALPDIVAHLGPALAPLLDRPFAFFGHSMGALIGFEISRWLRRYRQISPVHLFVSGRRAPQMPNPEPPSYLMDDLDFLCEIRKLNGTPPEILAEPELLTLILPILRADTQVCETYQYINEAPLSCPITAFRGLADGEDSMSRMVGWREQTINRFSCRSLPGDHFFIHSSERELLTLLRVELSRTLREISVRA
jgi:medium-chain acyl-[acyl-carrier-protein] hydrolase